MKRALLLVIPALVIAITAVLFAQPGAREPYKFELGPDITSEAADVTVEPKFRAVVDDRFAYEAYINATRTGTVTDGAAMVESFRHVENWVNHYTLRVAEDPVDGHKDPQLLFAFDLLQLIIDNGEARYTGFVRPTIGERRAVFHEILPDGKRSEVTNIPGWAGITASTLEMNRSTQARDFSASAWFSVADSGRLYNELYFADWGNPDQTSYPGRLQEPLAIALATQPEFTDGAKVKIGESIVVRRRMPVGAGFGGTVEYDITYKLEKLYGTKAEPTAARFSFEGVPVQRNHARLLNGLNTSFTAPDIKGGSLLLDLTKGVAAHTQWSFILTGTVNQPGSELATKFEVKVDFSASLRGDAAAE